MKPAFLLLVSISVLSIACSKHKSPTVYCPTGSGSPITHTATTACYTAPVVIYKTKNDYSNNISVLLSNDQTQVLAYPGITDAAIQHPVPLANGYYLQEMVGNAFTSYTFADYAAHGQNYNDADFLSHIADCAPFTEYWVGCSSRDTATLNNIIRNGQLSTTFQKLN